MRRIARTTTRLAAGLLVSLAAFGQGLITNYAGTEWILSGNAALATRVPLGGSYGIAADNRGFVYISDAYNHMVVRLNTANGVLAIVAGNGIPGFSGDGGSARNASLNAPFGVAVDTAGNLYVADTGNHRIRRVSADGTITTIAGTGERGFSGDGGDARNARLYLPRGLAFSPSGELHIVDTYNNRIRAVNSSGVIRTIAGTGQFDSTGDGGLATAAAIAPDHGIVFDRQGRLIFSEPEYYRVRMIEGSSIRPFAGNGREGAPVINAAAANSPMRAPEGLAVDSNGNVFIAEANSYRVYRVTPQGTLQPAAGNGNFNEGSISVDGLNATSVSLGFPSAIAIDNGDRIYFSDSACQCVRSFGFNGTIRLSAGNSRFGRVQDGTPIQRSYFFEPRGLVFDRDGALLVTNSFADRVDRLAGNQYQLLAGRASGYGNDGGPATEGLLDDPAGITVDGQNRVFFSEQGYHIIRMVDSDGTIRTFAGNGKFEFGGDNGPARSASFKTPAGVAFDAAGNLFIADSGNRRIRRITPQGTVTTFAGDGVDRSAGDNGQASAASFRRPWALAFTRTGDLLIADRDANRVRRITPQGLVTTIAGNGAAASSGDGGQAAAAALNAPSGLAVDGQGRIYIIERTGHRVRRIDLSGVISTIAGTGVAGSTGDGGPSTQATLNAPDLGIAVSAAGDVYISDTLNNRIRVIRANPPRISVDRNNIQVSAQAGQPAPSTSLRINADTPGVVFVTRTRVENNGTWLELDLEQGSAPGTLQVNIDASGLPAGRHAAAIEIRSAAAVPNLITVPVVLVVQEAISSSSFNTSKPSLSFTLDANRTGEGSFDVVTDGGTNLAVDIAASTDSGGEWLTVSSTSVQASPRGAAVRVAVSSGTLAPGTYSGSVILRSAGRISRVGVTMVVKETAKPRILLSQSGLSFVVVSGGGMPADQPFAILNEGSGSMTWAARSATLSGGDWLALETNSGTVDQPLLDVSPVNVGIRRTTLPAGEYYGRVEVTAASDNSPQYVMVIMRVLPPGSTPPPEVRPAGLLFVGRRGQSPGSQSVTVNNLLTASTQFASTRVTFDGTPWFTHSPGNAAVAPNDPKTVVVQPDYRDLAPGVRRGAITMVFADGSIRNVGILSVVAPADANENEKDGARGLGSCGSQNLNLRFTSLRDDFVATVGQPLSVEVRAVDDCGNLLTPQSASISAFKAVLAYDGETNMVHIGNGVWTGTLKPTKPSSGPSAVSIIANVANRIFQAQATGTVQVQGRTPIVVQGSLRHSATLDTNLPVAPGQLISILGGNLADGEATAALPLPRELNQTEVLLAGRSLPLLYTSDGQINAQVPYDLPANTQHQLMVRRGTTLSVPEQFVVADAQPGIFTRNEQGFGQGIITKLDFATYAEPATPAERGEEVIIFCTGLGRVTPALDPGQPAPDPPPAVAGEVSVTIGGQPAEVRFAGLTPGSAGRYQVRVVVPQQAPAGDEVPVIVTSAGRSSQTATMAIR